MKKIFLGTTFNKCKNNAYYTTQIYEFFKRNGFILVKDSAKADFIIIVTCGFDDQREDNALKTIHHYRKKYLNKKIIVTGCLPKIDPDSLNIEGVTLINLQELDKFNKIFNPKVKIEQIKANKLNENFISNEKHLEEYTVQICQGCTNNCSYCAIKKAKGYVKSKPIKDIVKEIEEGILLGYKKFVLLADDCGSYGIDINTNLAKLLNRLRKIDDDIGFNVHYMYPQRLLDLFEQIDRETWKKICYVNIPLQSTSKKILARMNRNYDVDSVFKTLKKIKKINPQLNLLTHIIVGFPGETRKETYDNVILKDYFDEVLFFIYSSKKGTKAYDFKKKIDKEEMLQRIVIVQDLCKKFKNLMIGNRSDYINKEFN